jgi:hypothetical protein
MRSRRRSAGRCARGMWCVSAGSRTLGVCDGVRSASALKAQPFRSEAMCVPPVICGDWFDPAAGADEHGDAPALAVGRRSLLGDRKKSLPPCPVIRRARAGYINRSWPPRNFQECAPCGKFAGNAIGSDLWLVIHPRNRASGRRCLPLVVASKYQAGQLGRNPSGRERCWAPYPAGPSAGPGLHHRTFIQGACGLTPGHPRGTRTLRSGPDKRELSSNLSRW